jgi:TatD DNase family protein
MLIDAHCHLDDRRYEGERTAVLDRARAAGVTHLVTVGCDPEGIPRAKALAASHRDVWCTVGIHPHHAKDVSRDQLDALETHFDNVRVVAVGECGLDFYYDHSPRERQREVFALQIALARRVKRPLMIHVRDAYDELLDMLRSEQARDAGGIIHCFTGTWPFARAVLDLDFDLSIPGVVTFQKPGDLPEVVCKAPLERLLTETDSPYLAPHPHRGLRNEPAFVTCVAQRMAELLSLPTERVMDQTAHNAIQRFHLI